ncbi:hypothetical protein [Chitinophaga qingshengii]|uniref:Uncharacterized protein n=1 Tax=Chitinophaga qingshengii TaxID=1569794 RepID=A0ABR7TPE2_9BACT|nr:hypothetical protein [Chitinophaga qingshengii]MBC9930894.1 hypothetical protein [Chitinophaga qingshengii]
MFRKTLVFFSLFFVCFSSFAQDNSTFIFRGNFDSSQRDACLENGVYNIGYTGLHTSTLLQFNGPGSSTGNFQLEAFYYGHLKFRSRIDNRTWSNWKRIWAGATDSWETDLSGKERLFLQENGATLIKGYGAKPFGVMDGNGNWVFNVGDGGFVGIGSDIVPGYRLAVAGTVLAERIKVKAQSTWPDYVFEDTYQLPSLQSVAQYIKVNKHLPEVPSATEIEKNNIDVGEMNIILLKKVEELTRYLIDQQQKYDGEIAALKKQVEALNAVRK